MERYRYFWNLTVPEYDCDPRLRLRASALLRYIQTVSGEHLNSIGISYERLFEEGFVFVVAATALKIHRCPMANENITVSTAPLLSDKGAHMLRETVVDSDKGERLAECQMNWALIDSHSGRLCRASDFPHELPLLQGEWEPFFDPRKVRIKPVCKQSTVRPVRLSDLDRNLHMNNTVYADILLDCFGEEYLASNGVDTMFIRYHLQARAGDELALGFGREGGLFTLGATLDDKRCFEGAFSLKPL